MTSIALGLPAIRRAPSERPLTPGRPDVAGLVDSFGRVAHDLRVSITEKCSLRCTYCMPEAGLPAIARENLLTADEIARLVGIGVRDLGIRDIRFTGGEPLMRADLAEIVAKSSAVAPGASISMTTNAIGLDHRIGELVAAGLTRVNISLDTVDRDHFARLTRRDRLPSVFAGIRAAQEAGVSPLKINAVLMRDTLGGAADLLEWSLNNGARLRFIEQMPLDADHIWDRNIMITADEMRRRLSERFDLTPDTVPRDGSPAELYQVRLRGASPDEPILGKVGIIASVTEAFCEDCRRTRLTADGGVRSCLFSHEETDLLGPMRAGASDDDVADLWRAAMWGKQSGHNMNRAGFQQPDRPMSAIGG